MKDYSEIENFNMAAIQAIRENVTKKDIGDSIKSVVSKKYKYKGRVLKARAEVTLWGYKDGEPILENLYIISVESVRESSMVDGYYITKYIKPRSDGYYVVLRCGFTYDMGNDKDLIPEIGYWNGGRGCFNEDYDNEEYLFWAEIPYFEGVDFVPH